MQNVSQASLVRAASSHATAQVEGHVTRGLEGATTDVLQAFMEIHVSRVRQTSSIAALMEVVHRTVNVSRCMFFIFPYMVYHQVHFRFKLCFNLQLLLNIWHTSIRSFVTFLDL